MFCFQTAVTVLLVCLLPDFVGGHGYLTKPPSRSSMWRFGYRTPPNWEDDQLYCGGISHLWQVNKGKCGVCGDPWDGPRENEAGGKYAKGIITAHYRKGQEITVNVRLTANHWGWFEFRICPNNDVNKPATHECFNRHLLQLADGSGTRYHLKQRRTGDFPVKLKLPSDMTCTQCIVQWKYHAGNNWNFGPDGKGCMGCGNQENFFSCSDVAILEAGQSIPSVPPRKHVTKKLINKPDTHVSKAPVVSSGPCHAIGNWRGIPTMDNWCNENCSLGNCPASTCKCK